MKKLAWAIGILALSGFCLVLGTMGGLIWTRSDYVPGEPHYDFQTQTAVAEIIALDQAALAANATAEPAKPQPTTAGVFDAHDQQEIRRYMENMLPLLDGYATYSQLAMEGFLLVGEDFNYFTDPSWQADMAFSLDGLDSAAREMTMVVDPILHNSHYAVDEMTGNIWCAGYEMQNAVSDLVWGIDYLDTDALDSGLDSIQSANDCLEDANSAMDVVIALLE